jgi:site-specific DNA-cytosine methylase
MMPLTYVELFAGAGGLSRGLEMAGWECVAHAEWDAHARAVLRRHWPDTPLFGDVSTLTGQMIYDASGGRPVTMLTGGSPCQDLSIAGKRAGMTEGSGTRSSLYFEQVRLWHELNAISPCPYLFWENVRGALSSNNGRDFAAVLSAIVGSPVFAPAKRWRGGGGVVSGCAGVAAWRVLDCQYFGHNGRDTVPQRRRRVFVLGVRAGGVDPAEVLSLLESLSGDSESGRTARQDTASDARSGVASGGEDDGHPDTLTPWDSQSKRVHAATGVFSSLQAATNSGQQQPSVFAVRTAQTSANGHGVAADITHTLDGANGQAVVSFAQLDAKARGAVATFDPVNVTSKTNRSTVQQGPSSTLHSAGLCVATVYDARGNGDGSVDTTLPGDHLNRITDYTPVVIPILEANARQGLSNEGSVGIGKDGDPMFTLQATVQNGVFVIDKHSGQPELGTVAPTLKTDLAHDMGPVLMRQREGKAGGGKGPLVSDKSLSLTAVSDQILFTQQALGEYADKGVASSIKERDHKDATDLVLVVAPIATVRPRRLMPIECERLMGWSDRWTERGIDEQGRDYALSDSARYKLCGNGVASPVAGWIGWRLRDTLEALR